MRFTMFVLLLSFFQQNQYAQQQTTQAAQQGENQYAQQQAAAQAAQQRAEHNLQAAEQGAQLPMQAPQAVTLTPRFLPRPGTYQGTVPPVTITDGTKGAVIYFTTDGSKPTAKSQRYTGPISLSATTTLKAVAIAPSMAQSRTVHGKYIVR